jgi:hypothetical protein
VAVAAVATTAGGRAGAKAREAAGVARV